VDDAEVWKQEALELRGQLKKSHEGQVRDQRLVDLLASTIATKKPEYKPGSRKRPARARPHEFLLLWSDLHAAERVFAEQVHGINEYTWDIMLKRHDRLAEALVSFRDNRPYPVTALRIAALGDMVSGDIHDELRETNEMVLMEATLQLGLDMSEWVESLVPEFPKITIDGIVGNHGRTTKKPQNKNAFSNFDWIFYHVLKLRLAAYPSVTVTVPKSAYGSMVVKGKRIFLFHGDGVRSTMQGVPWGGVIRRTRELEKQFAPVMGGIDHFTLGHYHQMNITDDRRIIINGSVKGPDEYSIKNFGAGSPASQILLVFNEKYGLTETAYIDLQLNGR